MPLKTALRVFIACWFLLLACSTPAQLCDDCPPPPEPTAPPKDWLGDLREKVGPLPTPTITVPPVELPSPPPVPTLPPIPTPPSISTPEPTIPALPEPSVTPPPLPFEPPPALETVGEVFQQLPDPPSLDRTIAQASAVVTLSTSASAVIRSRAGIFQLVGVSPEDVAQVTVKLPPEPTSIRPPTTHVDIYRAPVESARLVYLETIDGGSIFIPHESRAFRPSDTPVGGSQEWTYAGTGIVSVNGTFTFSVQVGRARGIYHVRLQHGKRVFGVQFWVRDPLQAATDPPTIQPMLTSPEVRP